MTTELFLGAVTILTMAAVIIVALTAHKREYYGDDEESYERLRKADHNAVSQDHRSGR
ncbi:hypothetical protein ACFSUD_17800 [Sulfitobacter aestuarii]|uniref:Cbb3-type cytochrome oxidase assembly protein CcoS n=1 Tax=Sulfitobacter aestuarii TaxID=2161676 RepID=A0ABW5U6K9_9RHOB